MSIDGPKGALEQELERLLVETNDLRRRAGQAFYHFYRTLAFWADKGLSFSESTRAWAAGGAAIFDTLASVLREMTPHSEDAQLRTYVQTMLGQLAGDLERGNHMRFSFLRWMEGRFPFLTKMMQQESPESAIYDFTLARNLADAFTLVAGAPKGRLPALLRQTAFDIRSE